MEAFVGTILPVAFNFAPQGWFLCNGQLLNIAQNQALFALLGTQYGGNGTTTFALPNLQGRVPIHQGQLAGGASYPIGSTGGAESVTLTVPQMPAHTHNVTVDSSVGNTAAPSGAYLAPTQPPGTDEPLNSFTKSLTRPAILNQAAVQTVGNSQSHENRPPYLVINYIICSSGIFPSRS